jgi:predicted nucleic acid-binding protein
MVGGKVIYLDSCIFIASFMKEKKLKKIKEFFEESENTGIEFVTSDWTLTEIVKVLIKEKKISPTKVWRYIQELERTKRIEEMKFDFIKVNKKKKYDFEEFFYEVQKTQLKYKGALGDAIHVVIMKNNEIKTLLTTDNEFEGMKGMIVINPLQN